MSPYAVDFEAIHAAAGRIRRLVHRTPVVTCTALDHLAGRSLFLKCENLQRVGSFKMRGAANAVWSLDGAVARRGVVTHSSGNFAQALALAARQRGVRAFVVMPRSAPRVKVRAVEGYGAEIRFCEPTLAAREATAAEVLAETGGTLLHPYDHPDVIAGQGTAALELLEEVPDLDAVIAPVGGGGLVAGTCIAARGLLPGIRLFAAEPKGADDAARSLAAGVRIPQTAPNTIADGLLTSLGELTWPVLRDHLEAVVTVRDDEIVRAMRLVFSRAKLVVEPSAAVAVAAVLGAGFRQLRRLGRVGVILSGGNVDLDRLPWLEK
jgi:threonine dehydratase/serine racemase